MYSVFKIALKYFSYYAKAQNGKGHGVHSPFVYDFIIHVLRDKKKYDAYDVIEKRRDELMKDKSSIGVEDFGAGSAILPLRERVVKNIAGTSLKSKKYAQLIYRVVKYYMAGNALELGTCFGITTAYISKAAKGNVYTFEGAKSIAAIARESFSKIGLQNITLTEGDFAKTLSNKMNEISHIDFAFVDGNHRKEPTLQYFRLIKKKVDEQAILIFDDIHWSKGMEEAWEEIKNDENVTMTIDLFFIGIVFFRNEFKVKQHFTIRF